MKTKFIFVTGGVLSSLGKGLAVASLGALLKARGLSVTVQKLDPYLNIDPGTLNPLEHGEVFVTDDGAEADLDLGHYERYLDVSLSQLNTITSGRIYWRVLNKERRGEYKGAYEEISKCMLCGKCRLVCPRGINTRGLVMLIKRKLGDF